MIIIGDDEMLQVPFYLQGWWNSPKTKHSFTFSPLDVFDSSHTTSEHSFQVGCIPHYGVLFIYPSVSSGTNWILKKMIFFNEYIISSKFPWCQWFAGCLTPSGKYATNNQPTDAEIISMSKVLTANIPANLFKKKTKRKSKGQSRDTRNIGHTRQRTKTNKKKTTKN